VQVRGRLLDVEVLAVIFLCSRGHERNVGKIVVGVDGSDASKEALRWALDEAKLRGATVVAVNAWQVPLLPIDVGPPPVPALDAVELLPEVERSAQRLVESVVEEVAGGADVDVEPVAAEGPAVTVLIEAARDAELLVVGSRGRGGFLGLLLGSVSLQVAQHAPCPVVIDRQATDP
jgi:nucleotide-binding universal stress UspA family protein